MCGLRNHGKCQNHSSAPMLGGGDVNGNGLCDVPARLSELLLALYAACDRLAVGDFQHEALRLVQEDLRFDSAFWAAGVLGPQREPVVSNVCLFNQPQEMLASYERVKRLDSILGRALSLFGTTVNVAMDTEFSQPGSEAMRAHGQRFGMRHVLATMTRGPISELLGAISLYRSNPEDPFSESDRVLTQCLVPHLVALHDRNRLQNFESSLNRPERRLRAMALINREGMLYNVNPHFIRLMREEWPAWHGPLMPPTLLSALFEPGANPVRLSRVAVHVSPVNDLYLLHIREIGLSDSLSQREWDVARAFGDGMSHKEIARKLRIAPGTVRNHIRGVYKKLGVDNKAGLVHSLALAPR
jgi:DNA-binding CsgD family transcriptional regulator